MHTIEVNFSGTIRSEVFTEDKKANYILPDGGTDEKPVGLTFIGLAGPEGLIVVHRHVWTGGRLANKTASADAALDLLLEMIDSGAE